MVIVFTGWGYIIIAMALYLFYAINRSNRNRRHSKHERLKEKQEELLQMLLEKQNEEPNSFELLLSLAKAFIIFHLRLA